LSRTSRTARSRTSFEYRFAVPINSILSQVEVSGKAGAVQGRTPQILVLEICAF
jgi:hypothetical protein